MGGNKRTIWRGVRRFFFGVLALLLFATIALVALHTYYHFTPVELSDEARSLDERAAALTRDTDNGLRLVGLLAPHEMDPVTFGRCVLEAERRFWSDVEKESGRSAPVEDTKTFSERMREAADARKKQCAGAGTQLQAPDGKALPPLTLSSTRPDWNLWSLVKVEPMLWTRYEQVMGTAPRYLAPSMYSSGLENFGTLMTLHRIRMALAVDQWRTGQTDAALDAWETSMRQWARVAPESLISSMLAVAAMSQTLASMHAAWQEQSSPTDPVVWGRVQSITRMTDSLPAAIEASVVTEWALTSHVVRHSISSSGGVDSNWSQLSTFLYDRDHTLNLLAEDASARAPLLRATAEGKTGARTIERSCSAPNAWLVSPACQIVGRNPVGQVLASVAMNSYESYGTRVADLLNFAAATRLIAEAKKRGVGPAALPDWIEQARTDQRDLYTNQPFSFDPAGPALRVPLKHRNPVLGEAGEYRLPL